MGVRLRMLSVLILALAGVNAFAARVSWDIVTLEWGFTVIREEGEYGSPERFPNIWALCNVSVSVEGSHATITADPGGVEYMSPSGAWAVATYGEVVDESMLLNRDALLKDMVYGIENPNTRKTPVTVEVGSLNYMQFIVQDVDQCIEYIEGHRAEHPDYFYGWMEYVVNQDGTVNVLVSALDIDGDRIVVGAIPEPSAGLLALLGFSLLALRRTRLTPAHSPH